MARSKPQITLSSLDLERIEALLAALPASSRRKPWHKTQGFPQPTGSELKEN